MNRKSPAITELVQFKTLRQPRGFRFPLHLHHFYQSDVILSGTHTLLVEGQEPFHARAGDGWLIPPLVRHGFASPERCVLVDFKFHLAPALWPLVGTGVRRHRFKPFVLEALKRMGRGGVTQQRQPLTYAQALATATLCLVEFVGDDGHAADDRAAHLDAFRHSLWPVLARVENGPYGGWSVATMAGECHLSVDHFSKCFHETLGLTPQRYLLEARMLAASNDLLEVPPRPIKKIAESANYSTVHSFSLAFKKVFGTSPAAYRRADR